MATKKCQSIFLWRHYSHQLHPAVIKFQVCRNCDAKVAHSEQSQIKIISSLFPWQCQKRSDTPHIWPFKLNSVKATRWKLLFLMHFCLFDKLNINFVPIFRIFCQLGSEPLLGCHGNKFDVIGLLFVHWWNTKKMCSKSYSSALLAKTGLSTPSGCTLSETESLCSILNCYVKIFLEILEWLVFGRNGDTIKTCFWYRKSNASIELHQHGVSFWQHVHPHPQGLLLYIDRKAQF